MCWCAYQELLLASEHAGAHLLVRNMSFYNASMWGTGAPSRFIPTIISMSDGLRAGVSMDNIIIHMANCDTLVHLQQYICDMVTDQETPPPNHPWPSVGHSWCLWCTHIHEPLTLPPSLTPH